ncbi:MAG: thioesterase family protein [Acidiferrobacterales bacterium]
MTANLPENLEYEFSFTVPENKTVPYLYAEAPEFQQMPKVFATGFMVGLCEWACVKAINEYIDWPATQTVGTRVNLSHLAATPPGLTVTVKVKLLAQEGRKLKFAISAHDGVDTITEGTHERMIVDAAKFSEKLKQKIPF